MEKMKANVFHGKNDIRVKEVERPRAGVRSYTAAYPYFPSSKDCRCLPAIRRAARWSLEGRDQTQKVLSGLRFGIWAKLLIALRKSPQPKRSRTENRGNPEYLIGTVVAKPW